MIRLLLLALPFTASAVEALPLSSSSPPPLPSAFASASLTSARQVVGRCPSTPPSSPLSSSCFGTDRRLSSSLVASALSSTRGNDEEEQQDVANGRRRFLANVAVLSSSSAVAALAASPTEALAQEVSAEATAAVEMKNFVDPDGLFVMTVPKRFYALRRKAKGDLPDEKTGKGRRGSSIFTAGDMAKAEVIAVERFPAAALLEEAGITATGDLSTFPSIGRPSAVAELINARRERERQQSSGGGQRTNLELNSAELSEDGKTLTFRLRTRIDVQKPELLLEQTGVSELFRVTVAKATLDSNDGNMMAVFASALETDYVGPDGEALRKSVDSFRALDRSGK